jgi:hypothetical protein
MVTDIQHSTQPNDDAKDVSIGTADLRLSIVLAPEIGRSGDRRDPRQAGPGRVIGTARNPDRILLLKDV